MAKETINNGESGLIVRDKLNDMFTELYAGAVPLTFTSEVTGSGTSSIALTIASNVVTNSKLAQMPANTFKGNNTGATANSKDLTRSEMNDALIGYATTLTAAGTTTLTVASKYNQYFTGTSTQDVVFPDVTTLYLGFQFKIVNNSTGIVTVKSSGGDTIMSMSANSAITFTCILLTGTDENSWSFSIFNKLTTVDGLSSYEIAESGLHTIISKLIGGNNILEIKDGNNNAVMSLDADNKLKFTADTASINFKYGISNNGDFRFNFQHGASINTYIQSLAIGASSLSNLNFYTGGTKNFTIASNKQIYSYKSHTFADVFIGHVSNSGVRRISFSSKANIYSVPTGVFQNGDFRVTVDDISVSSTKSYTDWSFIVAANGNIGAGYQHTPTENLDVLATTKTGGLRVALSTKTNDYIVTKLDYKLLLDATSNTILVELLDCATANHGQEYIFKAINVDNLIKLIAFSQTTNNILDISNPSGTTFRYTKSDGSFAGLTIGDYIKFSGCTNSGNNGTFVLTGTDSSTYVEIGNASGVVETGSPGLFQLNTFDYDMTILNEVITLNCNNYNNTYETF